MRGHLKDGVLKMAGFVFMASAAMLIFGYSANAQGEAAAPSTQNQETFADQEQQAQDARLKAQYQDYLFQFQKEVAQNQEEEKPASSEVPQGYSQWKAKQNPAQVQSKEYRAVEKAGTRVEKEYNKVGK